MRRLATQRLAQRGRPAVPDHWTGRPGGSGAQPPLHLIYMVKVGRTCWVAPGLTLVGSNAISLLGGD